MTRIKNWEAKRAGGRITVNGVDAETDKPIKVAGVEAIEPLDGKIVATHHEGAEYELLSAAGKSALSADEKVKRVGGAVVKLEGELIAEGKREQASALVAAFATLPPASMATLHDLLAD